MLKLLKWDLINLVKKYYLLLLGIFVAHIIFEIFFFGSFGFAFSFEDVNPPIYRFYTGYRVWNQLLIFTVALLTVSPWLHKSSAPLIASIYSRPWKIVASKLIVTVLVNSAIFFLTDKIIEIVRPIANQPNIFAYYGGIVRMYFSAILLYSTVVILSLVFAKSFNLTRKSPILSAGIIYFLVMRIFSGLYQVFVYSDLKIPEIKIIIPFAALLFASGCILYKRRFQ